jgi:predicted amidohydrolase YtcJ
MSIPEHNMIILNADVVTLDPRQPKAEAIAIHDGKIVAVGTNKKILKHKSENTTTIDCKQKTVVPGLVDSHVHMLEYGFFLQELNLRNTRSIKEMRENLREHAQRNPRLQWIVGGRWDEEKFSEKRYPTKRDLDTVASDKPVFLNRVCGHLAVVNEKALKIARITKHTKVNGGKVDLDPSTGEPNGILRDNAMELVWKHIPKPSQESCEKACSLACENAVRFGLTEVHWLVGSAEEVRVLQTMMSADKLPLRVYLGIPVKMLDAVSGLGLISGFGNDMLKVGFIKILADGSLGARTAALRKPYSDAPRTRGLMLYAQKKLCKLILKAHGSGLQIGVHAIGDRATEKVIQAFRTALKEMPRKDHRHRIEHCSILNAELVDQMKDLEIIASVQPHFVVSDVWTVNRIGSTRARWAYPFKTLIGKGIIVASGSDCPVELINPLLGLWAAVNREDNPRESLTFEEALRTYTINAAFASFDENRKGTIERGKYADLTIFSDNISKVGTKKIRDLNVEMTIVNGKINYSRQHR